MKLEAKEGIKIRIRRKLFEKQTPRSTFPHIMLLGNDKSLELYSVERVKQFQDWGMLGTGEAMSTILKIGESR